MVADPDRERNRRQSAVTSLELRSADEVKLSGAAPHGTDKVGLQQRLDALCDEEVLLGLSACQRASASHVSASVRRSLVNTRMSPGTSHPNSAIERRTQSASVTTAKYDRSES